MMMMMIVYHHQTDRDSQHVQREKEREYNTKQYNIYIYNALRGGVDLGMAAAAALNESESFDSMEKKRWVIGVDGGGTKTHCVVVLQTSDNTEKLLASFTSGPSNHNSVGESAAKRNVFEAIRGATLRAMEKLPKKNETCQGDVCGLCVCMSGVDTKQDEARVEMWIRDEQRRCLSNEEKGDEGDDDVWRRAMQKQLVVLSDDANDNDNDDKEDAGEGKSARDEDVHASLYVVIENDAVGALCSGTKGVRRGCVLIAGTGTIAVAMESSASRRRARVAGWGAAFGDGGCGYDIGYKALCVVARILDGRIKRNADERGLVTAVMRAVGVSTPDELLAWAYRPIHEGDGDAEKTVNGRWDRVAALAPVVLAAAESGDTDAERILSESVTELAESVEAVVRALSAASSAYDASEDWTGDVVFVGGLLIYSSADNCGRSSSMSPLAKRVQTALKDIFPHARFIAPSVEPAMGAALLIARLVAKRYRRNTT